jgi:hypothetical protein
VKPRLLVSLASAVLAPLVLAACGGGSSDEGEIVATIEKVATTDVLSNCTELQTVRFLEQDTRKKGEAAVEVCEAEMKEKVEQARRATVSEVEVEGEKATAVVAFDGGSLDAQSLDISLVKEGHWKIDHIDGFAVYEGKALAKAFAKELAEGKENVSPKVLSCFTAKVEAVSRAEAGELFLGGSTEPIIALVEECAS